MTFAQQAPRRHWVVVAAVVAAALCLLIFSLAVTDALVTKGQPGRGLGWWTGADRKAKLAASLMVETKVDRSAEAMLLAREALRREPANVLAMRTIALATARQGATDDATALFKQAEALSRRDMPTQLWLIETHVEAGDIDGALLHYDRALRVSAPADRALIPILVKASADPAIRRPLGRRIAVRPPWWTAFANSLVANGESAPAIYELITTLKLDPDHATERSLIAAAIGRLIDLSAYQSAFRVYANAVPEHRADVLRNGGFEGETLLPPFDWSLMQEPDLGAIMQARDGGGGGNALSLYSDGRNGIVASQMLMLTPGRYRLTAEVGEVAQDPTARPGLSVACAGKQGKTLTEIDFPKDSGERTTMQTVIDVPAGCAAQILRIAVRSVLDQRLESWIDNIEIRRF